MSSIVFVASINEQFETNKVLIECLERALKEYKDAYGPLESKPKFLIFDFDTSIPFPPTHLVRRFFKELLENLGERDRLTVVVNGWDGLTTNRQSFLQLLENHQDQIDFFVFAEEARYFHEVDVREVCEVLTEQRDLYEGDFYKETKRFIREMDKIQTEKVHEQLELLTRG